MIAALLPDGFNLLPYRSHRRRDLRRRRLAILAAAGLAGCAAAGAAAGWDHLTRARLDERRIALDASIRASAMQIGEHARLARAELERRRAMQSALPLAVPRDRFLGLLSALAESPQQRGVALQRVSQRADEVELGALAPDSEAAALWLKRLEDLRGVQSVEVTEMKQRIGSASHGRSGQDDFAASGRYEFTALVRYARDEAKADAPPTKVVARARTSNAVPKGLGQ
jgi:Tfp pilus assembly protein PilN